MDYMMGPFGPMEMPEEIREKLRTDLEMQRMTAEEQNADFRTFVNGLDETGLRIVRGLVRTATSDHDQGYFVVGYLTSILQEKFGVCMYCQEKHLIRGEEPSDDSPA